MIHNLTLMIGSNHGDRENNIAKAMEMVGKYVDISQISPLNESDDFSGRGTRYLNSVVIAKYDGDINLLIKRFKEIETRLGRDRSVKGIVAIDIDIVTCNNQVIKQKEFSSEPYRLGLEDITNGSTARSRTPRSNDSSSL